jgi:hypothetical protein
VRFLPGRRNGFINVLWDAAPMLGDRISVVGAGIIDAAVARLTRSIPNCLHVTLVDVNRRLGRVVADQLGVSFRRSFMHRPGPETS